MYSFLYNNKQIRFENIEGDLISLNWKKGTFYEIKLLEKIKNLNIEGIYVDIGAHHGNHSIFFDTFCNSTKVISIEGNPFNFNFLKKNIELNECSLTLLHNIIITDKENEIQYMKYNLGNTGSSRIIEKEDTNKEKDVISNNTITLDKLLENEGKISLMKFDIENYEYKALLGAEKIISKYHPIIIIELHNDNTYYQEIINFLKKYNYKTDGINYAHSPTFIYQ